jgi:UDPglucose 6-dehydrogenase
MSSESEVPVVLSVIGLGKLGAPMAAVFASKGYDVVGADLNSAYVDAINARRAPVDEPQLEALLAGAGSRLRATTSTEEAVTATTVTFVIVPTPSQANHFFSTDFVVAAVERIGRALRGSTRDHLVVITSTVMPGDTGGVIRRALESASGRVVGADLGLCYSPEFIALGSVVQDLLNPDMVLIGESDPHHGEQLERIYRRTTESSPVVHRMNFVNAEICKIAVNTFVTTKISYANMLADLCDHLSGADVDTVSGALGSDSRIGHKYLKGGVAYGGPCFPRDNKAFAALGRSLGVRCDLAEATDRINDHQVQRLLGAVQATTRPGARVGVLGMSYKLHTPVVEKSQGLALARVLAAEGYQVTAADPLGSASARAALGSGVDVTDSLADAIRSCDVVVVTTPWPAIRDVASQAWTRPGAPLIVIDPWCLLQGSPVADLATVISLGRGGYRAASGKEAVSEVAARR